MSETATRTTTTVSARHNGSGLRVFVGILLLIFFVMGSILHIQTSEAFFLSGSTVGISPNWSILLQPVALVQGTLSPEMAKAVMWGWGIELVFLICVVGYESVHDGIATNSRRMSGIFRTGTLILVLFDGYADFQYGGVGSGFWGQLAFAAIMSFVVFFFGTAGWHLVFGNKQ